MPETRNGYSRQSWLNDADSETLNRIIIDNPGATLGRVRLLFRHVSGREIGSACVSQRRKYLSEGLAPDRFRLSEAHKAALAALVGECDESTSNREIASIFGWMQGRSVSVATVARFRKRHAPRRVKGRADQERDASRRIQSAMATRAEDGRP